MIMASEALPGRVGRHGVSHHVLSHMCLDTRQSHPFAASVGRRARGRLRLAARAWEKLGAGRLEEALEDKGSFAGKLPVLAVLECDRSVKCISNSVGQLSSVSCVSSAPV